MKRLCCTLVLTLLISGCAVPIEMECNGGENWSLRQLRHQGYQIEGPFDQPTFDARLHDGAWRESFGASRSGDAAYYFEVPTVLSEYRLFRNGCPVGRSAYLVEY